jgi:hypothetical protein
VEKVRVTHQRDLPALADTALHGEEVFITVGLNRLRLSPALDSSLIADAAGDLFATTVEGGVIQVGTVFEIIKTNGTCATTPATPFTFNADFTYTYPPAMPARR